MGKWVVNSFLPKGCNEISDSMFKSSNTKETNTTIQMPLFPYVNEKFILGDLGCL